MNMNMDMQKINKQTMVQQAIDYLRQYILSIDDEADNDLKLPAESTIAKNMGLSRLTIREALTVLESEGLISRSQGSPTMITTFARRLADNIDYTGELGSFIKDCGYELQVKIISLSIEACDKKCSQFFDINGDDEVLIVKKSFFADGKPAAYCINRLSKSILNNLDFDKSKLGESMFDFVKDNSNYEFSYDYMEFIPELVTNEVSRALSLELNTPILRVDVTKYATNGDVIMYNTEYYADNLIRFSALRNDYGFKLSKLGSSVNSRREDKR